jgi:hypothetical protein
MAGMVDVLATAPSGRSRSSSGRCDSGPSKRAPAVSEKASCSSPITPPLASRKVNVERVTPSVLPWASLSTAMVDIRCARGP